MSEQHDNKNRRPGPSFYLLAGLVLASAWQYSSIGAITWPTRVASKTEQYLSRAIARVEALLPGHEREIEWSEDPARGNQDGSGDASVPRSRSTSGGLRAPDERPAFLSRARVLKVVDGDSLELDLDGTRTRVRMRCIDAPEFGQAYGSAARRHLESILRGTTVLVEGSDTDAYDRLLARIYTVDSDTSLNWHMVRAGYAWDNTRFSCGMAYARAEDRARAEKAGLWREGKAAVPPWEWRQSRRGRDSRS